MNRLVHSLEMQEGPRSLLNERMHLLANEAFPNRDHDPEQQDSWFEYMRLATSFVVDALLMYKKVILEGTRIDKAPINDNISRNEDEDEDQDAANYPLL